MFATPVLVAGGSEAGICVQIHCASFIGQVRKLRVSNWPITKQQRDGFSEFGYKVVSTVLFSPRGHTREGTWWRWWKGSASPSSRPTMCETLCRWRSRFQSPICFLSPHGNSHRQVFVSLVLNE